MVTFFLMLLLLANPTSAAAQTHNTVDVSDEIYSILTTAELRGLCLPLQNSRPFTQSYINKKLDEIIQSAGEDSAAGKIALKQKQRFAKKENGFDWQSLSWRTSNKSEKIPVTFSVSDSIDTLINGGVYSKSQFNAFSYELWNKLLFTGDIGRNVSYSCMGFVGFVRSPLQEAGEYTIGKWWYDENSNDRKIKTFRNNAFMPYSHKKFWDGSIFYLSNLTNSGLEGWAFEHSFGYGMYGEITMSFLDGHINIGLGRYNREYAAMDRNSSLVLNAQARPFFGIDLGFNLFKWLSLDTTMGILEFPNQGFSIKSMGDESAWPKEKDHYYFQNMFAIAMLNLDWKYFHFDFGSSVVYPKRTELGYFFPLIDRVVYQDNLGDYDNLALFIDLKGRIPNYAELWVSFYLDEKQNLKVNKEFFEKTRNMFAYQVGVKANLPDKFLPYSTVSFRYTKIEPYCYTHNAINYTPWYKHYISESYTNNGSSLGYYLPPNSDEILLRLDTYPTDACNANLQFQMTRHGADYGNRAVPGSSIYSELPAGKYNKVRDGMRKYFLNDGAYEWTVGVSIGASYNFKKHGAPVTVSANVGFLHIWWTDTDSEVGVKDKRHKVDSNDTTYPSKTGVVMSLAVKVFGD